MQSRTSGFAPVKERLPLRQAPTGGAHSLTRRLRAGAVALALVGSIGLLSACGGGGGGDKADAGLKASPGSSLPGIPGSSGSASPSMPGMDMSSSPDAATGSAGAPAPAPAAGNAVAIKNFAFSPASLTVKAGTKVTWTNQDSDAHTVTSDGSGGPLNSKAMNTGDTFSYTFTKPGTYKYLCTIHPFMTATVTVTQ
jgi:plastocyanin